MLTITKYLTLEQTQAKLDLSSCKRVLEHLAALLAKSIGPDQKYSDIVFEKLLKREKLGSTAIDHGMAIPRAKDEGLTSPVISIITLAKGIEFEAEDKKPVDIFVGLLVPEGAAHQQLALTLVSDLTSILHNQSFCRDLREAESDKKLYNTFLLGAVMG